MADLKISALTASTTPLAGTEVLPIVQSSTTKQVSVANLTAGRPVSATSVALNGAASALTPAFIRNGSFSCSPFGADYQMATFGAYNDDLTNGGFVLSGLVANVVTEVARGGTAGLTVTSGNVIMGTAGKGIDFSATPGTGTSELLADYEEGTFTITISGSTSGSGTVAGVANYIKVGKIVTLNVAISNVTFPTYSGTLQIGLPFAAKSDSDGQLFGAPMYFFPLANWTTGILFAGWIPRVGAGASVITFQLQQVNGDRQTLATNANTTTSATSGLYTSFSLTYLSAT